MQEPAVAPQVTPMDFNQPAPEVAAPGASTPTQQVMAGQPPVPAQLFPGDQKLEQDVLRAGAGAEALGNQAVRETHDKTNEQVVNAAAAENELARNKAMEMQRQNAVLEKQANDHQVEAQMQKDFMDEYRTRVQKMNVESDALLQQVNAHLAASHPKDIWTAAGVNPVIGAIAVGLSGMGGGPNQAMEIIKARAGIRAAQLSEEHNALGMKASVLAQMYGQAAQIYDNSEAGVQAIQATYMKQAAEQVQMVANTYAGMNAGPNAQIMIQKFNQEALKLNMEAKQLGMQGKRERMTAETNILHAHAVAQAKLNQHKIDQIEQRKILEGREATNQALQLIEQYKALPVYDVAARNQILESLAPLLAKADQPGSNRIPSHDTREAEKGKVGGFNVPFLGRVMTNPDKLAEILKEQQAQREGNPNLPLAQTPAQILGGAQ